MKTKNLLHMYVYMYVHVYTYVHNVGYIYNYVCVYNYTICTYVCIIIYICIHMCMHYESYQSSCGELLINITHSYSILYVYIQDINIYAIII